MSGRELKVAGHLAANLAVNYSPGNKGLTSKKRVAGHLAGTLGEKVAGHVAANLAVNYFLGNKGVTSQK